MNPWPVRFLASMAAFMIAAACAPSPKSVPCSNTGDCETVNAAFKYCLQNRCVECVSDSSCGTGNACDDGICERACRDGRDCSDGQACSQGRCSRE